MSNVPAGGFKMTANKTAARKQVKPMRRSGRRSQRDLAALACYHAESVDLSLLPRDELVSLYLRCVQALASSPEEEEC